MHGVTAATVVPCPSHPIAMHGEVWCMWRAPRAPKLHVRSLDDATALCDGRLQSDGVPLVPDCDAIEATPRKSTSGWSVTFLTSGLKSRPLDAVLLRKLAKELISYDRNHSASSSPRSASSSTILLLRSHARAYSAAMRNFKPTTKGGQQEEKETPPAGEETKCVGWRQTGGCDPDGVREESADRECDDTVASGASGYCLCGGKRRIGFKCHHPDVTCASECRVPPGVALHSREAKAHRRGHGRARSGRAEAVSPSSSSSALGEPQLVELVTELVGSSSNAAVPLRTFEAEAAAPDLDTIRAGRVKPHLSALVGVASVSRDLSQSGMLLRFQLLSNGLLRRLAESRNVEEASLSWFSAWLSLARTSFVPLPSARRISFALTLFDHREILESGRRGCKAMFYCREASRRGRLALFDGIASHPRPRYARAWHALALGNGGSRKGGENGKKKRKQNGRSLSLKVSVAAEKEGAKAGLHVAAFAVTSLTRPIARRYSPRTADGVANFLGGDMLPLHGAPVTEVTLLGLEIESRSLPARIVVSGLSMRPNHTTTIRDDLRYLGSSVMRTDSVAVTSMLELGISTAQLRRIFSALLDTRHVTTRDLDAVEWLARVGADGAPRFAPPTEVRRALAFASGKSKVSGGGSEGALPTTGGGSGGVSTARLLAALKLHGDAAAATSRSGCNDTAAAAAMVGSDGRQLGALELSVQQSASKQSQPQRCRDTYVFTIGTSCSHLVRGNERCFEGSCRAELHAAARRCLDSIADAVLARQSIVAASESLQ